MINSQRNRHYYDASKALTQSPFTFHLTGSYLFGGQTNTSDWDFVVENSPQVVQFLQQEGFAVHKYAMYTADCDVIEVYRRRNPQIDVQLVGNIQHRLMIQKVLLDTHALKGLPKFQRARVWRAMYRVHPVPTSSPTALTTPTSFSSMFMGTVDFAVKKIREMRKEKTSLTCTCGANSNRTTMGCHQHYCDLATGRRL